MGSIRKIICPCGFKSQVSVGGTMKSFREYSTFPFYCEKCGLVEVNIEKDELICPKCNSLEVKQRFKAAMLSMICLSPIPLFYRIKIYSGLLGHALYDLDSM